MSRIVASPLFAFALAALGAAFVPATAVAHPHGQQGGGCPMMGQGMMGQGMGCGMNQQGMGSGMMGGMRGMMGQGGMAAGSPKMHVMMMISAADTDGDQAVSFDEVTAIHRRMFDMADENKDGKIDRDEAMSMFSDEEQSGQPE